MKGLVIPVDFFKAINEKNHNIRIYWLKWLSDYTEHLSRTDFPDFFHAEMSKQGFSLNLETITEAYEFGMPFFKDGFTFTPPSKKPRNLTNLEIEMVQTVLNYLNEKCGSTYTNTKPNRECILARIKEGFKIPDLIKVIDKKASQWLNTEQEKYLRPITLFQAKKFENYLNEPDKLINDGKKGNISKLSRAANKAKGFLH